MTSGKTARNDFGDKTSEVSLAILNTFSRSQKKLKGHVSDVFTYDDIPQRLRVQIANILVECLGNGGGDYIGPNPVWQDLHRSLANEFGLGRFPSLSQNDAAALAEFFVNSADTEQALDIIQVSFTYALRPTRAACGQGAA
jgi:hypothetical protein